VGGAVPRGIALSGHVAIEARAVGGERQLEVVEDLLWQPFGLASIFTISGGAALIKAAFATRLSPCRAR
jgi:hypothetical protein